MSSPVVPTVTTRDRRWLVDGVPRQVTAGEIHYFRVPRQQWAQRLSLAAEAGCTVIASYLPWLLHELPDGTIDVTGRTRPERDIGAFIDLVAEHDLQFLARPGPYVMAELKNEGLPYRVLREHPEIIGTGWDGAPVPTAAVDYLHPAFLAECERWYAAVMPVLAPRLHHRGGPVVAVQLDNEIGMLPWVSNTPTFTDTALADLARWLGDPDDPASPAARYPLPRDPEAAAEVRRAVLTAPAESWAADLRVDLALFFRDRFARYTAELTAMAARYDVTGVPLLVNIHGTEGGNGVPYAIGVSQLLETFSGVTGVVAGSDHYLGDMTPDVTVDMHFVSAVTAAVNGPDQPLTSLEFEAGTGDYGAGAEILVDPSAVDLKTRLAVAQGNRLVNYYLLAGGTNPPLDAPVGDGNDRISSTGERHGTAAPIDPEGRRGPAFASTARVARAVAVHERWLADADEQHDDLAVGFLPDAFATEYHYPGSAVQHRIRTDLEQHRGPGQRKALWRSLLFAGYRFGAVDLQRADRPLPRVLALASGVHLDGAVQQRLVDHLRTGGRLLHLGPLPTHDLRGRPCTVLLDALGLEAGEVTRDGPHRFPSVRVVDPARWGLEPSGRFGVTRGCTDVAELRVGWLQQVSGGTPVLRSVDGEVCGVEATPDAAGAGRAVLLAAELPATSLIAAIVDTLGAPAGLQLDTDVPGVMGLTGVTPDGQQLVHLLNPGGFPATVSVALAPDGAAPTVLGEGWRLPPRTGLLLGRDLRLADGGTVLRSATAELQLDATGEQPGRLVLGPSVDPAGHTVVLQTARSVQVDPARAALSRTHGLTTVTTTDAAAPVEIRLG